MCCIVSIECTEALRSGEGWPVLHRRETGGLGGEESGDDDTDPPAGDAQVPVPVLAAGVESSVLVREQAVLHQVLLQGHHRHTVRESAAGDEVFHGDRAPHRLHGRAVLGEGPQSADAGAAPTRAPGPAAAVASPSHLAPRRNRWCARTARAPAAGAARRAPSACVASSSARPTSARKASS